ncbi:MAG: ABC transporter ATP-binding protein [Thermodesulfobacteriota bacterium]
MSTNGMAVSCRGVTKTYVTGATKVLALRGIDLDVRVGELLMLVGPSGCGKTTLISVIAGILDHDEGDCLVFEQNVRDMGQTQKTRYRGSNIGFVFQAYNLIPTLSVMENVAVPLLILGKRRAEALSRARELLTRVGLEDKLNVLPSDLSGGQQQRVAIARALVHGPKLIVCDEPTSALDADTGRMVLGILRETALSAERALIIVTHDNRIFNFADRIARMDDGRITLVESQVAHP